MLAVAIQDDFLTIPQAADVIGVTPGRVRQMVLVGQINGEQVPPRENGRWLIPRGEAERVAKLEHSAGRPRSVISRAV